MGVSIERTESNGLQKPVSGLPRVNRKVFGATQTTGRERVRSISLIHLPFMAIIIIAFFAFIGPAQTQAATGAEIQRDSRKALEALYAKMPSAKALGEKAKAVLVFPSIKKGGLVVGGQYGEGVLFKKGKAAGYYNTTGASYGLQAGAQKFGYALFFMTDDAVRYLDKSGGWELGSAPSIVVIESGAAGGISTTTAQSDMYAFFFNQKGLMAGLGLQGTKITRIKK